MTDKHRQKLHAPWAYKGITILPASRNAYGIRWTANAHVGYTLRAETKEEMRRLITEALNK